MRSEFTLEDLVGVWRRRSIETEDGQKDTTTQVFWLQTHTCFGDIRIPLHRFLSAEHHSVNELSALDKAIALSSQQGFGGITHVEGSTCQWHRHVDYQPPNGSRDIGLLEWEQDILIESGVEATYREEWERLDDGSTGCCALVLKPDNPSAVSSWQGCFVLVGDYFVFILDRRTALPKADSLNLLLDSAQDDVQKKGYLNCEISFGRCSAGQIPWEIELSTLPWREGQSLWNLADLAVDLNQGCMTQTLQNDPQQVRRWNIKEWNNGFMPKG